MPQIAIGISAAIGSIGASFAAGGFFTSIVGRLLMSVAFSALSAALVEKPPTPGILTQVTANGGDNPLSFVLGRYATAGVFLAPPMSHGTDGKTPNAYLTYVIAISALPGVTLNRIIVDGEYAPITGGTHPTYGDKIGGPFADYAWIKWKNDSTVADSYLTAKYSGYPKRPWSSAMIGRGITYAILTFRRNAEIFKGLPQVRFEVDGAPLYDPRKDSTNGGSGSHRYGNVNTWEQTNNPAVMIYNILRGLTFADGSRWGGESRRVELPTANWFAAMNGCGTNVPLAGGGSEPRYRAGYEISTEMEPFAVIGELLKASNGAMAEVGGQIKMRVGGPGASVFSFTDDQIVVTRPQEYDPFPGLGEIFNGVESSYPAPGSLWNVRKAPSQYRPAYQIEDDNRQLVAQLDLPAVPWKSQVQRLGSALIKAERRFARHVITLPPSAMVLEPLDVVSWTSERNGYIAKKFEVIEAGLDPITLLVTVSLREVNPNDYDYDPEEELADDDSGEGVVRPVAQAVEAFAAAAVTLLDNAGAARRPAVRIAWNGAEQDGVQALEYELREQVGGIVVGRGSINDVTAGEWTLPDTVIPKTQYEVKARWVIDSPRDWTGWNGVTTPTVVLGDQDVGLPDISNNLIRNGRFKHGDLRFWGAAPAGWSLKNRTAGGNAVITASPTEYMLEMDGDAVEEMLIDSFDLTASDQVTCFASYAQFFGTNILNAQIVIRYYSVSGALLRTDTWTLGGSTATWRQNRNVFATAPVGTLRGTASVRSVIPSGASTAKHYLTLIRLLRQNANTGNDFAGAALALTNTFQAVTTYNNSVDQDAADSNSIVMFSCRAGWDSGGVLRTMEAEFELTGPGGYTETLTFRQTASTVSSQLTTAIAFNRIIAPFGVLPEQFRVRARRLSNTYDVNVIDASLIVLTQKG